MENVSVVYTTDGFATTTQVPLALGARDAGARPDAGSAPVPGEPAGTQVVWYLVGNDYCTTAPQYYSNLGANHHYMTQ